MIKKTLFFSFTLLLTALILSSCSSASSENKSHNQTASSALILDKPEVQPEINDSVKTREPANAATILSRKQVPVLCYHQIREWTSSDSKTAKDIITPLEKFRSQIKILADSGYTSILPDQLYNYLVYGDALPEKPVMITFDDNDGTQYSAGNAVMKEFGFKGVYFIMTVTIGRPRYMSKAQLKELSDEGNVIASHTWDHHNVQKYSGEDWITQIEKPSKILEEITGKKVEYFAYPFGLWNEAGLPELESRGMKASFILSTKRDSNNPMQTIRRMIGSGYWSGKTMYGAMLKTFEDGK